ANDLDALIRAAEDKRGKEVLRLLVVRMHSCVRANEPIKCDNPAELFVHIRASLENEFEQAYQKRFNE
ncbi:unnamed protein product, partial [marine sediment metagenome]